jgi:hypothetical protein
LVPRGGFKPYRAVSAQVVCSKLRTACCVVVRSRREASRRLAPSHQQRACAECAPTVVGVGLRWRPEPGPDEVAFIIFVVPSPFSCPTSSSASASSYQQRGRNPE